MDSAVLMNSGVLMNSAVIMNSAVMLKFESYPEEVKPVLICLREYIFAAAEEHGLGVVEESLKWGEPSFAVKGGSPVRIDWKSKHPDKYFVYFQCQTRLIETFKELYGDLFTYDGKRAIVLALSSEVPVPELKHCIALSLQYHSVKHLPLLGA